MGREETKITIINVTMKVRHCVNTMAFLNTDHLARADVINIESAPSIQDYSMHNLIRYTCCIAMLSKHVGKDHITFD